MTRTSLLHSILSAGLLVLLSCSGTTAYADRKRVAHPPAPGPVQWNHDWARGAVFYEVFVRSFSDSDGDGIGDLNGLISKLDYLKDLGVDGIWLMPVFESPSYHGYDTIDYETIEKDYGSNADFQRLLDEAHKRGIRVIVDLVMNHTSSQHPWFIESSSSTTSPRRDWYVWSPVDLGWKPPWGGNAPTWHPKNGAYYYGVFWSGMPDINYRNPAAKAEMFRIARYWLSQGVDGFRLDATRHLVEDGPGALESDTPETHQILKELATDVRRTKPESILVAENWTDTPVIATYFGSTSVIQGGDEMPMNFNFPLASAAVEGVNAGNTNRIRETLRDVISAYPRGILDAPFLTNHDQTRLATVLGNDAAKLRNAAAILLTLPGTPFLYYGEEVGLDNGPTSGDESKRTPMPWTASGGFTSGTPWFPYAPGLSADNVSSQTGDPRSLLSHYRNWIAARRRSPALQKGDIALLPDTSAQVLAFTRDGSVLVVHNVSDSFVNAGPFNITAAEFEKIHSDSSVGDPSGGSGAWRVAMPPRSSGVWRVR